MRFNTQLLLAAIAGCGLAAQAPAQVVYTNNFESGATGPGFFCPSATLIVSSTPGGSHGVTKYLGPHSQGRLTLNLGQRPAGRYRFTVDLFIILTWDGNSSNGPDKVWMQINGSTILYSTFACTCGSSQQSYPANLAPFGGGGQYPAGTGAIETNTLGYATALGPADATYRIVHDWDHPGGELTFECHGMPNQNINDEAWGLDNIALELLTPAESCYANCDHSSGTPTLNVADFICFLNKYAAGCP